MEDGYVMESFDVTSLYTNVSKDSALQAVSEILIEHQTQLNFYGLSISCIMTLLNECLMCNVFRWSGQYYKQVRGLAMGQRLAPVLAVAFMSKVEEPVLGRTPVLYCRYIDDCFIVCSTQAEMDICFELLNHQSEHIKLTREVPKDNWLAFLNVQVHLSKGVCRTMWYRKPSSKNIIVHFSSAHSSGTKKAIIKNMYRTAAAVSSGAEERTASIEIAHRVAEANGYPSRAVNEMGRRRRATAAVRSETEGTKVAFVCLLYQMTSLLQYAHAFEKRTSWMQ